MSLNLPSRRLLRSASALNTSSSSSTTTVTTLTFSPTVRSSRSLHTTPAQAWFWDRFKKKDSSVSGELTGSAEDRRRLQDRMAGRLVNRISGPAMFEDDAAAAAVAGKKKDAATTTKTRRGESERQAQKRVSGQFTAYGASKSPLASARAIDPDPRSRVRWERKMVIRQIQRGTDAFSREPKKELLARTERQILLKSPKLPTSVKKLVMLARQIQGKPVADALTQMRFSKKKMAKEVAVSLRNARDAAVVERGMGMGSAGFAKKPKEKDAVEIRTKDGKHMKIADPTRIYVAEAWVNREPYRQRKILFKGRGRTAFLRPPATSISVVLKEEHTRIREHKEREAKKWRQGPWIHLPNRPITAQRPFYSW